MKPEKAISLLQRGIVGEIYDEKGYLTALGYEALDAIDRSKCPTLVQRPHGEWVKKDIDFGTCWATCSVCNKVSRGEAHDNGFGHDYSYPNFCPKCGSDNRKSGDEK